MPIFTVFVSGRRVYQQRAVNHIQVSHLSATVGIQCWNRLMTSFSLQLKTNNHCPNPPTCTCQQSVGIYQNTSPLSVIALPKTLRQLHLAVCLGTTPAPLTTVFRSGRVGTKRNFLVMMMSTQPRQLIQPKLPLDRRSLDHKLKKTICKKHGKKSNLRVKFDVLEIN